jgi:hypothetical protein
MLTLMLNWKIQTLDGQKRDGPLWAVHIEKTVFLNISEKSYLHYWKARKFKMLFPFSTLGRNSCLKMYHLSKTTPLPNHLQLSFIFLLLAGMGFRCYYLSLEHFVLRKQRYIKLLILNFCTKFWILAHSMGVGMGVKPVPSTKVKYSFET